ncbi:MAG: methyltransferase domain-containing protein [Chitinophagaceae bacterium]|nr:methyltransferase domain-containing protein [Chitinophagaceae bacterium]
MKNFVISILKLLGLYKTFIIPPEVVANYIELNTEESSVMKQIITGFCKEEKYDSKESRLFDIDALFSGRLLEFRQTHIPFLTEKTGLKNKKVLEIGCGTGASTIALSEQGALVTGIDIDESAIEIAQKRADIYRLHPSFLKLNATQIETLGDSDWDIIMFVASLEHMTPKERQASLKQAFSLLKPGGHLCVFGTPNRLWPYDLHTSLLPFYMWLQDELAMDYARFSPRTEFSQIHTGNFENKYEELYRWGRGVSFHEIELALGRITDLKVTGSLPIYLRKYGFIQKISYRRSDEFFLKRTLSRFGPKNMHPGFYECYLDIIIEK